MLSFRRTYGDTLMEQWYELEQIAHSIRLTEDSNALIWKYTSSGLYSSSSLYAIINYRGVFPTAVWSLIVVHASTVASDS